MIEEEFMRPPVASFFVAGSLSMKLASISMNLLGRVPKIGDFFLFALPLAGPIDF